MVYSIVEGYYSFLQSRGSQVNHPDTINIIHHETQVNSLGHATVDVAGNHLRPQRSPLCEPDHDGEHLEGAHPTGASATTNGASEYVNRGALDHSGRLAAQGSHDILTNTSSLRNMLVTDSA